MPHLSSIRPHRPFILFFGVHLLILERRREADRFDRERPEPEGIVRVFLDFLFVELEVSSSSPISD